MCVTIALYCPACRVKASDGTVYECQLSTLGYPAGTCSNMRSDKRPLTRLELSNFACENNYCALSKHVQQSEADRIKQVVYDMRYELDGPFAAHTHDVYRLPADHCPDDRLVRLHGRINRGKASSDGPPDVDNGPDDGEYRQPEDEKPNLPAWAHPEGAPPPSVEQRVREQWQMEEDEHELARIDREYGIEDKDGHYGLRRRTRTRISFEGLDIEEEMSRTRSGSRRSSFADLYVISQSKGVPKKVSSPLRSRGFSRVV